MKNKSLIIYCAAFLFIISCGKSDKLSELKSKIETKKKEFAKLSKEIKQLQKEIDLLDTLNNKNIAKKIGSYDITPSDFTSYIEVQGNVDSRQTVDIMCKMPGNITKILAFTGQKVSAGQILAYTENSALVQQAKTLQTQLSFAKDIYNRQKSLWEQKIGTEVQYLQAKNNVEMITSQIATLQENIEMTYIKAPVSGTIDDFTAKIGMTVSPGFPLGKIVNIGELRIICDVAETYISKIRKGAMANIKLPDMNYETQLPISHVGSIINPMKRTFNVELKINRDYSNFKPNMVAKITLKENEYKNAIVIPANAVQYEDQEQYVYVIKTNNNERIAERRTIIVEKIYNGKALVKEGLNMNEAIVTTGASELSEGDFIN